MGILCIPRLLLGLDSFHFECLVLGLVGLRPWCVERIALRLCHCVMRPAEEGFGVFRASGLGFTRFRV